MRCLTKNLAMLFQFLMVQLKEQLCLVRSRKTWISIPYGSIKRLRQMAQIKPELLFQFLMVQLKALIRIQYPEYLTNFNSLWFN